MIKLNKLAITAKSAAFLDAINIPIKIHTPPITLASINT